MHDRPRARAAAPPRALYLYVANLFMMFGLVAMIIGAMAGMPGTSALGAAEVIAGFIGWTQEGNRLEPE